jgi:tubulin monoglycylase TTLL3/8
VNHFEKETCFTSKDGLCKTLRDLYWYQNELELDTFYPKTFMVSNEEDLQAFICYYKIMKVS